MDSQLRPIWIEGEISNYKRHSSGHHYFSLKDNRAQLRCVMFRFAVSRLKFEPDHGMAVRAYGRIGVFEAQGSYQLYVELMEPAGLGALHQAFEKLKNRLKNEGLFDEKWKKKIPVFPHRIGIVTSETGAAIEDIIQVISRRFPLVKLLLCPTRVQGEQAAKEIVQGIKTFNLMTLERRPDVLIVGRGGGSLEDLWPFNEEPVARAIWESDIPIISAVGHEIDFTISDFVADKRAPTPSAAAEMVVPDGKELKHSFNIAFRRLISTTRQMLSISSVKLKTAATSRMFKPIQFIRENEMKLDGLNNRVTSQVNSEIKLLRWRVKDYRQRIRSEVTTEQIRYKKSALEQLQKRLFRSIQQNFKENKRRFKSVALVMHSIDISTYKQKLAIMSTKLKMTNPQRILEMGFAICRRKNGEIVTTFDDVSDHEEVIVKIRKGQLICEIKDRRFI